MAESSPAKPLGKLMVFRSLSLGFALGCGIFLLGLVEFGFRARERSFQSHDVMDPGLIRYDETLGWTLTPNASGGHTNQDFGAVYRINEAGFRADSPMPRDRSHPLHAFVGDSFVFGFGVTEEQTFVHRLNQRAGTRGQFVNYGVPGYSTDQEALLIERELVGRKPDVIWLVVYLANDLLDNQFSMPMQVRHPKPFFEEQGKEIVLRNTPVPHAPAAGDPAQVDLGTAILGRDYFRTSWRARLSRRSAIFRSLDDSWLPAEDLQSLLEQRLQPSVRLFQAILARIEGSCREHGIRLRLVLMPGRAMVERPESLPGRYQKALLQQLLLSEGVKRGQPVDLGRALKARFDQTKERYFFPVDGHLTPAGQEMVAEVLAEACAEKSL